MMGNLVTGFELILNKGKKHMGKTGQRGGNFYAQNYQAGEASISTNASGNGSVAVVFRQKMEKTPVVLVSPLQSGSEVWTTGVLTPTSVTRSGFTVYVRSANTTSSVVKISYTAIDDTYY
jgi:hypothetical protein